MVQRACPGLRSCAPTPQKGATQAGARLQRRLEPRHCGLVPLGRVEEPAQEGVEHRAGLVEGACHVLEALVREVEERGRRREDGGHGTSTKPQVMVYGSNT